MGGVNVAEMVLTLVPEIVTTPPLASMKLLSTRPLLSVATAAFPLAVKVTSSLPVDVVSALALPMRWFTVMPLSASRVRLASLAPDLTMAALTKILPSPETVAPAPVPAVSE